MLVTVAICTHNRAASLARALTSLTLLVVPDAVELEILVIDNASTDDTRNVVAAIAAKLPLRYLREPRLGLSHARNLALAEGRGELLIFFDDDVIVDPAVVAVYAAAAAANPVAVIFGGTVLPELTAPAPWWFRRFLPDLRGTYSLTSPDLTDGPMTYGAVPIGANFALRSMRLRGAQFEAHFGRTGQSLGTGEETALIYRLLRAGDMGLWVIDAVVRHEVSAQRLRLAYFWRVNTGVGRFFRRSGDLARYDRIRRLPRLLRPAAFACKCLDQSTRALWRALFGGNWILPLKEAAWAAGIAADYLATFELRLSRIADHVKQRLVVGQAIAKARRDAPRVRQGATGVDATNPRSSARGPSPLLVSVMRDEAARLPTFFRHYRALGIEHFVILDHESKDETVKIARNEGALVIPVRGNFIHKPLWLDQTLKRLGRGRWCLVVDADELLVYPEHQRVPLATLCRLVEREGATAVGAKLVDLYPDRLGDDAPPPPGMSLLEQLPYFDPHLKTRYRTFGADPCLTKTPLFVYRPNVELGRGQHVIAGATLFGGIELALLHLKLLPDFIGARTLNHAAAVAESATEDRAAAGETSRYATLIAGGRAHEFLTHDSLRYRSPEQLFDLGVVTATPAFRRRIAAEVSSS